MAKPHITRTFGPIHFEDLDAHRFEDLVRELIYDFRDWQNIEATGRGGSDEGFDIRGFEKTHDADLEVDDEEVEFVEKRIEGNLWMIQCKREKVIGPQKISSIISECINSANTPYGYILVASANFSKKSYDIFRSKLRSKGVMEFYLLGKAELEDLLHMPKYDRILFTFFGISLASRKRTKTTEVKTFITVKNKLFKILGKENTSFTEILVRDINDEHYPSEELYSDFAKKPRWKKYRFQAHNVKGIWLLIKEYYGYYDKLKNEWDYSPLFDLTVFHNMNETEEERIRNAELNSTVRAYWELLPRSKQRMIHIWGLLKFDRITAIDEKGDALNDMLQIYVDYKASKNPFDKVIHVIGEKHDNVVVEMENCKKQKIFPDKIPIKVQGVFHKATPVIINKIIIDVFKENDTLNTLYDIDKRYNFLKENDLVQIIDNEKTDTSYFIKITASYNIKLETYLAENAAIYNIRKMLEKQLGENLNVESFINVYEFQRTYRHLHI